MDATHPLHNPIANYGWIKRGQDYTVKTNTGRRRLNINGAMNISTLEPVIRYDDMINAHSTLALFKQIEAKHLDATSIPVIADNARDYRAKIVSEYLKTSRIQLIFLPPYAPNLNLIERYWKFFKKIALFMIIILNARFNISSTLIFLYSSGIREISYSNASDETKDTCLFSINPKIVNTASASIFIRG